ncbi:hypothetical protein CVT25_007959 [Psilocybe cyanescens]|uniref:Uncharacterized protein n=1 Tax=Psilocybe cyanescens TaxID=93625 RepID=A0A409XMZ7_PSICY|nr:hypothetical protein CVT25_007959 [Psilocybe cyanescens]
MAGSKPSTPSLLFASVELMHMPDSASKKEPDCVIAEILQHTCLVKTAYDGTISYHCFPIPRILKLCPGQPAVELTKFINIEMQSGEIDIPPNLSASSIKARSWKEVIRSNPEHGKLPPTTSND